MITTFLPEPFCPTFKCLTNLLSFSVGFETETSEEEKEEEVMKLCGRGNLKKKGEGEPSVICSHIPPPPLSFEFPLSPSC